MVCEGFRKIKKKEKELLSKKFCKYCYPLPQPDDDDLLDGEEWDSDEPYDDEDDY